VHYIRDNLVLIKILNYEKIHINSLPYSAKVHIPIDKKVKLSLCLTN
jgi:hypothetical protein